MLHVVWAGLSLYVALISTAKSLAPDSFQESCCSARKSLLPKLGAAETYELDPAMSSSQSSSVKVLGVCGGIGSGKSKACELLVSELGCLAHIESDSLAHSVYEPGSLAIQQVVAEFGEDLLNEQDGTINRKKLGNIVFADASAMARLERIVWPHVQSKVKERIQALLRDEVRRASCKYPIIIVESAVLLEAGWQNIVDGVWVVTVPRQIAQRRLQQNRGLSIEEADKRIDAQQSRRGIGNLAIEVSSKVVSAVLDNSGTVEELTITLQSKLDDPDAWYTGRCISGS
jgi:dephospho-CoA kinase